MIEIWKIGVAILAVLLTIVVTMVGCTPSNQSLNETAARESYWQAYGYCKTLTVYDDCMRREGWKS